MSDSDRKLLFMLGFTCGFAVSGVLIIILSEVTPEGAPGSSWWKREAITHGAAHYDSKTGEWQWNDKAGE